MSRDALIVGVSTYQYLPSLSAPGHDAEAIAQRLQTDGDFRVTRLPEIVQAGQPRVGVKTPVRLAELEAALVRLFKPKGNHIPQTALFYYSGHGLQKDAGIQEGFLATSDANPAAGIYGLSLFWLRRLLQESPVRQRILLLDCCHSGELLNFLEADPGARSGTDRLFMAASREYEAAYESIAGNYSVFTQALLEGLDPTRLPSGTITSHALTDWVSNALKGEMQQPLFESSGSEMILTRCQNAPTIIKTELTQEICPYRGLEFFDEVHAGYFFGREELTDQLVEKLRSRNFVAVLGASGSGKSSLIRAGLIHKLRQGRKFSGCDSWRIQLITPTEQPLKSLATAFVNPKAPAVERAEQLRRAEVFLREGGTGLSQLVRASLMSAKQGRNSRLLLIIDQFEEMFTLCQGPQAERDRHRFFNCLLAALQEVQDCFSVVIVLRADFFGKCSLYNGLAEQIEQNLVTVTPLTYEQIKASVVKPAQKVGLMCEPNLVYNILLDVVGAPGELPLLQYTLLELWQQRQADPEGGAARLTLDAYTQLGGVRGTLQKRADETFYSLNPEEQQVAKRIFIALTQLGDGTEDTRRRVLKSELVTRRFSAELVDRVLEKLVAAKLVVTNRIVSTNRHREQVDQGFANVSTALRLAQMRRGKSPQPLLEKALDDPAALRADCQLNIAGMTRLSAHQLSDVTMIQGQNGLYQETVDVAHEALIRNWSLLRIWLDENREFLRRQRRIEHAAREWYNANQPQSMEYLLHGDLLLDAEDYLQNFPDDLSAAAQRYISVSCEERHRSQKELGLLRLAVPCTLLVALVVTFNQYWTAVANQTEKDYQAQLATSRQRAAIAQSILQDPNGDPTAALLISRLAVEQGGQTYEAQASLRAALQKLRLQANLADQQGALYQVAFSPDQQQLLTAGEDGTIRLWSTQLQKVEKVLKWEQQASSSSPAPMVAIAVSPDGKQVAGLAQGMDQIQVWSIESGKLQFKLTGFKQAVTQLAFSPTGEWIAGVSADKTVRIWNARTGSHQTSLSYPAAINRLDFSPDGQWLAIASGHTLHLVSVGNGKTQKILNHPQAVSSVRFSPVGQVLATGCEDGRTRLWQIQAGKWNHPIAELKGEGIPAQLPSVRQVLFSPNGQFLATTHAGNQVRLWQVASGQLQAQIEDVAQPEQGTLQRQSPIAFSPDSQLLVTTRQDAGNDALAHKVQLWNVQTGTLIDQFRAHAGPIAAIQFSGDGALIATASSDGFARLWAAAVGGEFPTVKMPGEPAQWVAFRKDKIPMQGSKQAMAAIAQVPATNPNLAEKSTTLQLPLALSANGLSRKAKPSPSRFDQVVSVAWDGTIHRQNLLEDQAFARYVPPKTAMRLNHSPTEKAIDFLKQVGELAAAMTMRSPWRVDNALPAAVPAQAFTEPDPAAEAEANSASSTTQATVPTTVNLFEKITPSAALTAVALSDNSEWIAAADSLGGIEVWQLQPDFTLKSVSRLQAPQLSGLSASRSAGQSQATPGTIRYLAFSPDYQKLLGVEANRSISVWEVSSGKLLSRLQGHEAIVEQAHFSPDGQRIVSASQDRTARIWDVESGELLTVLHHPHPVISTQFSPDGQQVVTTSSDGIARVMDAGTGALRVALTGHQGGVLDVSFNPDGRMLVTASEDGSARIWDAQTGTERAILRPISGMEPAMPFKRAFFSPDGRFVATLDKNGQLHLWTGTWEGLLELARDRSLRQLKPEECLRYLGIPPDACPVLPHQG